MRGGIAKKGNNYYPYLWIHGKKKWFSGAGTSKRAAEAILNEKLVEVQRGTYQEIKKITFRDFTRVWLESYARTATKPSTLRSYEDIIEKHLTPEFGDAYLTHITTAMLQRYVAKRLAVVKPKTVVNELVPTKELFRHAVRWGFITVSPAEYVEKPRVEREEMDILTPREITALLDDARGNQVRTSVRKRKKPLKKDSTYIVVLAAVLTGLRRGELFGLQRGDLNWDTRQIHVRRALWKGRFITPKSKLSVRKVDMTPFLARELKTHILENPQSELDLVFCNSEGGFIDPDLFIKREFIPALRRAQVRAVRFHDLRHTNVALRIEQGQHITYIQRQLGHASIQTTLDRYGHLLKDADAKQAKRLDALLGFSKKAVVPARPADEPPAEERRRNGALVEEW